MGRRMARRRLGQVSRVTGPQVPGRRHGRMARDGPGSSRRWHGAVGLLIHASATGGSESVAGAGRRSRAPGLPGGWHWGRGHVSTRAITRP
jgi:hypothetical protein